MKLNKKRCRQEDQIMKQLYLFLILFFVCTATSFGAWDYVISGGYHGTYTLTGSQSLLMIGGSR